jgi:hypothetical protein
MTTTDLVRSKALALAKAGIPTDEAVNELLEYSGEKRVPLVLARQQMEGHLAETKHSDPVVSRAAELLDWALSRLPLA